MQSYVENSIFGAKKAIMKKIKIKKKILKKTRKSFFYVALASMWAKFHVDRIIGVGVVKWYTHTHS